MTQSPTENGNDQTSSDSRDESLLDNNQHQSADEQHDTVSGDDQSQDSGQSTQDQRQDASTDDGDGSSDDDGLKRFAKSQGFDPDNLTAGEKKALKLAHDNQKAYRNKAQQETSDELKKAVDDAHSVNDSDLEDDDPAVTEARLARSEAAQTRAELRLDRFFRENDGSRDLEGTMRDILVRTIKEDGKEAARYLTKDLNRLYLLAKAEEGDTSAETAREAGRREERQELRRRQEASADGSHAATTQHRSTPKVTRDWVSNDYDPSNVEHRKMLDEAINRGDLY